MWKYFGLMLNLSYFDYYHGWTCYRTIPLIGKVSTAHLGSQWDFKCYCCAVKKMAKEMNTSITGRIRYSRDELIRIGASSKLKMENSMKHLIRKYGCAKRRRRGCRAGRRKRRRIRVQVSERRSRKSKQREVNFKNLVSLVDTSIVEEKSALSTFNLCLINAFWLTILTFLLQQSLGYRLKTKSSLDNLCQTTMLYSWAQEREEVEEA